MGRKRFTAEQIIHILRQAEVEIAKGTLPSSNAGKLPHRVLPDLLSFGEILGAEPLHGRLALPFP